MSEKESTTEETTNGDDGGNGGARKAVVRAAALAAASGATALAAKKAFGDRTSQSEEQGGGGSKRGGTDTALISTFLSSGWDSAKGTVVPMLEDAATQAGEWVARNAPELVTDTIVPQFIRGFERAQSSSSDDVSDDS